MIPHVRCDSALVPDTEVDALVFLQRHELRADQQRRSTPLTARVQADGYLMRTRRADQSPLISALLARMLRENQAGHDVLLSSVARIARTYASKGAACRPGAMFWR